MTAHDDLDKQLNAFLRDGPTDLPDPSFDAVRDRTEQTRQRVVLGPWRVPDMNKFVAIGLGAAAVVVAVFIGSNLLGSSGPPPGGGPSDSAAPSQAQPSEPAPSSWTGLPEGPFVATSTDDPVQVTVSIASPGWTALSEYDAVGKNDDGLDAPETVGVVLIAWSWPAGTGFNVYGDRCHWSTTIPDTPATTPDEIAAALAEASLTEADDQGGSDAMTPVEVTVGGYAGKAVMLRVPMSYHQQPDVPREEEFADCDENEFVFYGTDLADRAIERNAQGPGQIDELWILDVNGSIVILDAAYSPATPADVVDELRTLAESATFE
jgi:hypothetical protein